jgi:xylulokinase
MFLLGYDLGSSSVKASLLEAGTGKIIASAQSPKTEMSITALQADWAEQDPEMWWHHLKLATAELREKAATSFKDIKSIGISYQMHGLVVVDKNQQVLRPSIIWCDSRAVEIGSQALQSLGKDKTLTHLFNSPGNFTASKLSWIEKNEPALFAKIDKIMLPGDYIAMKLTGEINTTASGLSEGIFWDFQEEKPADFLLDYYKIPHSYLAKVVPTFGLQANTLASITQELGIPAGTPVSYRAGDQPNNAFSLNVLKPGEVAATAGTSGVVYGISNQRKYDNASRVNTFLHVNHTSAQPSYGILLCINGTGIMNSWLKKNIMSENPQENIYETMNELALQAPVGSDGLVVLPFGNGAERVLENKMLNASFHGINFNKHSRSHLLRAAQEGIVFSLKYGLDQMQELGVKPEKVRAGKANMFLSPLFAQSFANTTGAVVELYNTDGAAGAARAGGLGAGIYNTPQEAFQNLEIKQTIEPNSQTQYQEAYQKWLQILEKELTH